MTNVSHHAPTPPVAPPQRDGIKVSFEFFPPKTEKMEQTLWAAIKRLEPLAPQFVSVTYGAAGSTRKRTHATVVRIRRETNLEPAAHLTCVGADRDEIDAIARPLLEGRHLPHRRPARRPAGARGHLHPTSRRLCLCLRSGGGV